MKLNFKLFLLIQKKTHNGTIYRHDMYNIEYRLIRGEIKWNKQ